MHAFSLIVIAAIAGLSALMLLIESSGVWEQSHVLPPKGTLMRKYIAVFALLAIAAAFVIGCGAKFSAPSIPAVSGELATATAHTVTAQRVVKDIPKHADVTGKAEANFVDDELNLVFTALGEAQAKLAKVQSEYSAVVESNQQKDARIAKDEGGWGFRLQSLVHRIWVWFWVVLIGAVVLHVGLGIAGLCISGPAGAILSRVGAGINPFAWFQTIKDNIFFNRQLKAAQAAKTS